MPTCYITAYDDFLYLKSFNVYDAKNIRITITSNLDWVSRFQKYQLRQLRQYVISGAIWHLHLSTLGSCIQNIGSLMKHLFGTPVLKLGLDRWGRYRGQLTRWTCKRQTNTGSVGDMLDELEWQSLETHREQLSSTRFTPAQCLFIKTSTPAPPSLRGNIDALKKINFPKIIPIWNSLPSWEVLCKTTEEFQARLIKITGVSG